VYSYAYAEIKYRAQFMIRTVGPENLAAINKALKEHENSCKALAKVIAQAYRKGARVRVPVGKGSVSGTISGKPDPKEPTKIPVRLDGGASYIRSFEYDDVSLLDDLFIQEQTDV